MDFSPVPEVDEQRVMLLAAAMVGRMMGRVLLMLAVAASSKAVVSIFFMGLPGISHSEQKRSVGRTCRTVCTN